MRVLLLVICFCLVPAALAAGWGVYEDARFGYVVGVPPGFVAVGDSSDGGDRLFASADGTQSLRAWGGKVLDEGYEATVGATMDAARAEGWVLSGERVTPGWAGWSGRRNGMLLEARMISLCGGLYAAVQFAYPERDLPAAGPLAERLAGSLGMAAQVADC